MESQPQNPEFGNNPENFHPCFTLFSGSRWLFAELAVKRAERSHDLELKWKETKYTLI